MAIVVLGAGVLAVNRLAVQMFREAEATRAELLAMRLLQDKADDLRAYVQREAAGPGRYGFDELGDDTGGGERDDGSLELPPGERRIGDLDLDLHWSVTRLADCADGRRLAPCDAAHPQADLARVDLRVAWTGRYGERQLTLATAVMALDPVLRTWGLLRTGAVVAPATAGDIPR